MQSVLIFEWTLLHDSFVRILFLSDNFLFRTVLEDVINVSIVAAIVSVLWVYASVFHLRAVDDLLLGQIISFIVLDHTGRFDGSDRCEGVRAPAFQLVAH